MEEEWIAEKDINGEMHHFVIIGGDYCDEFDTPAERQEALKERYVLSINIRHFSKYRQCIFCEYFPTFSEAAAFCADNYGVRRNDWQSDILFDKVHSFKYSVISTGIPQPNPFAPDRAGKARILVKVREDDILITGNREGLLELAEYILLCVGSEQYDEEFHVHFSPTWGTSAGSDVELVIYAPFMYEHIVSESEST